MKKRWLSLYVENNVGVLAKISCLFAGKLYNLNSLTVGTTEDAKISRMTISLTGDDEIFEQIKKQLNRCIDIIKVIDLTEKNVIVKELLFLKTKGCTKQQREKIIAIAEQYNTVFSNYGKNDFFIETTDSGEKNDQFVLAVHEFCSVEIVRSGSVAIEL